MQYCFPNYVSYIFRGLDLGVGVQACGLNYEICSHGSLKEKALFLETRFCHKFGSKLQITL